MKLIRKISQSRRDFKGLYKCEDCGHEIEYGSCYDDRNFHDNVIPARKCPKCNKSTKDLGFPVEFVQTEYPSGVVV